MKICFDEKDIIELVKNALTRTIDDGLPKFDDTDRLDVQVYDDDEHGSGVHVEVTVNKTPDAAQ